MVKWRSKKTKKGKTVRFPIKKTKSSAKSQHKTAIQPARVPSSIQKTPQTGGGELRRAGVGKFEGGLHIDQYVYDLSAGGWTSDEAGDVQETGRWYGLLKAPRSSMVEGLNEWMGESGDELTKAEKLYLKNKVGFIVSEDSYGFVDVVYYDNQKQLEQDWIKIQKEVTERIEGGLGEREEMLG